MLRSDWLDRVSNLSLKTATTDVPPARDAYQRWDAVKAAVKASETGCLLAQTNHRRTDCDAYVICHGLIRVD